MLPIVFLDSTTGIVRGHRTVLLSPEFSKELLSAIEAQSKTPINVAQQSQLVRKLYQQYTVDAMVKKALCRCVGAKWDEKLSPTTWQRN